MGWFLHWIIRPIIIGLIVRLIYGGGAWLLGFDPGAWLVEEIMSAPPSATVIEITRWAVTLAVLLLILVLLEWHRRKPVMGVDGLDIHPARGQQIIGGRSYDEVKFIFTNKTNSTVRLNNPRLKEDKKHFPIPPDAVKDLSGRGRELKFLNTFGVYADHERELKPSDSAITGIAISQSMDNAFYSYEPGWIRKYFHMPKYFLLRYTVTTGSETHSIETVY